MRKTLLAALAALSLATPASALDLNVTYSRIPSHWYLDRGPRIVHVPQPTTEADRKAQAVEIAKWEAFCQPTRHADELGVIRLRYAHEGCEFGRSE